MAASRGTSKGGSVGTGVVVGEAESQGLAECDDFGDDAGEVGTPLGSVETTGGYPQLPSTSATTSGTGRAIVLMPRTTKAAARRYTPNLCRISLTGSGGQISPSPQGEGQGGGVWPSIDGQRRNGRRFSA